ncbi:MAG: NERD domain-containing protein [Methanobrevibacter sp.]|nr:NERD domain-containing protein [Methanobrevibacter sp.]
MKVVCCKKCGAKYRLEDTDDISTYECTSCTGELELCDGSTPKIDNTATTPQNSNITYCVDCGLKYALRPSDNILNYECESCGGSLRYVDEYLNEDIDKIIADKENQKNKNQREVKQSAGQKGQIEGNAQKSNYGKSLSGKIGSFFSESRLDENLNQEQKEENLNKQAENIKTAKTVIPKSTRKKFEKEFMLPKTNDYDVLRKYLINKFYKNVSRYYGIEETDEVRNGALRKFTDLDSLNKLQSKLEFKESIAQETSALTSTKSLLIIIGAILIIASIAEIILVGSGIGIITLIVGVILIAYGLYRGKDEVEVKKRTKIIRDKLLSLPEEYYVFYDVRVPGSKKGINHLVIGPSGIYEIISKKYSPKSGTTLDNNLIAEEKDEERIEQIINTNSSKPFKYTTKQSKFPKDNKIKQTSLQLGENLINFLNENNIVNCFVEPLVGFVNENVVVINMPLTDEDLFIDELIHKIKYGSVKLDSETIDKCAVLLSKFAADCMDES